MTTREIACVAIECDDCQRQPENGDGGDIHFATEAEAFTTLADHYDWLITPTEQVCDDCRAKRGCAVVGHAWGLWSVRVADPATRIRFCEACRTGEREVTP